MDNQRNVIEEYLKRKREQDAVQQQLLTENTDATDISNYGKAFNQIGAAIGGVNAPATPVFDALPAQEAQRKQKVMDYLKMSREGEEDAVKLSMEQEKLEQGKVVKPQLPALSDKVVGSDGAPLYTAPGQGLMTQDPKTGTFTPYTGKPKVLRNEQLNINLGGLNERKKANKRGQERLNWDINTKINERVTKVGKALTEAGAPQYEVYKQDFLNQEDVAGKAYGRLASLPDTWMLTDEGQQFRGSVERLIAPIRKDLFGATLTGNEQASFNTMLGTGKGMSMAAFKRSLDKLIEAKDEQLEGIRSYDEDAYEIYLERKGKNTPSVPAAKTVTRKQYSQKANKTKITYSDGTEEIVDGKR
jgi:hypothetical protein